MTGLIVHEWIAKHGGSENVLQCMVEEYPEADIFCLWNEAGDRFSGSRVGESWLAKTPLRHNKALALPFMPAAWKGVNLEPYDWVLVSSHLFAHHVGARRARRKSAMHVYVHTPARYIWVPELDARGQNALGRLAAPLLKRLDKHKASDGARFAANSKFIQERIRNTWGQESQVIYPPVAVAKIQRNHNWADKLPPREQDVLEALPKDFVLGASRFVTYKNLTRVIEVGEAIGVAVVLAGAGPQRQELEARGTESTVPVIFVDSPSNELLYALYQRAMLYVFPPVEDFGIMPVEAMALGTPTIVNAVGGAAESVKLLDGGATVTSSDRGELRFAVEQALSRDMTRAMGRATMFSEESFKRNINKWLASGLDEHGAG